MNKYESVVLFNDEIPVIEVNKKLESFINLINEKGELNETEDIGIRKMVYEIKGKRTARYTVLKYIAENEIIPKLERLFRNTDEVLKYLTVKID